MYSDTLFVTRVSRGANTYAQTLATDFDLSCSCSIKLKSEACVALFFRFNLDGVSPAIICDNAKEMILREFNGKLKKASCHLRQTELISPWLNAAESNINELKKGSGRKLIKFCIPKRL